MTVDYNQLEEKYRENKIKLARRDNQRIEKLWQSILKSSKRKFF
jgi:hypothetical protein